MGGGDFAPTIQHREVKAMFEEQLATHRRRLDEILSQTSTPSTNCCAIAALEMWFASSDPGNGQWPVRRERRHPACNERDRAPILRAESATERYTGYWPLTTHHSKDCAPGDSVMKFFISVSLALAITLPGCWAQAEPSLYEPVECKPGIPGGAFAPTTFS